MVSHVFTYGMSRSGTTLLTAVLDAHPDVSMGYELLPNGIDDAAKASRLILASGSDSLEVVESGLEATGEQALARLVHRADRTLVSPVELAEILQGFAAEGRNDLTSFESRIALSQAITEVKARKEGTTITGFKLNTARIGAFDELVGDGAAYVYIVRDPRDIWASHVEAQFDRSIEEMAKIWNQYRERYERFAKRHPDKCFLLRYEDLVQKPTESLDAMCAAIGLPRDPAMDRFYESKASVLRGGHGESESLQQTFFTSSIGRWHEELSEHDVRALESACYEGMAERGYEKVTDVGFRFTDSEWARNRERLAKKRKYFRDEYAKLVLPAVQAYPHRTWLEATNPQSNEKLDDVLVIRHDIDNDIENAVRLARWEHEHGIRATYCVLHTAWYYGRIDNGRPTVRSEQMVDACLEIQSLGHEVSLHNNTVVAALRSGADPYELLTEELEFLRSRGLDIKGTSGHGHPLSGQLGFVNFELFSECVYPSLGGIRTLEHEGHRVTLGGRSMSEFGLLYEGYDLPRDLYISDSGGNLRAEADTQGRAGFRRKEMDPEPPYRRIVGILTHPVWWDLERDAPTGRPELSFKALLRSAGAQPPRKRLRDYLARR